jgi:type I restriction-modification system DNA methylase subunit
MTITTKEQLRDHIHSIHDYLRNCGAGYGMTAMKIFMIFYGLKIIEPIIDKTPLDPKICKFSEIIKNANKKYGPKSKIEKDNPISNFIDVDILDEICKDSCQSKEYNLGFYMFHQIPKNLRDDVWIQVIKYIDEIPTNKNKTGDKIDEKFDVDLSGKVYEYFIGRDATAISELGAYFTDRHVTGYVLSKVKPTLKDGHVKKMIDPFGGSGGFTLGYTQYLNNAFGDKIDWKEDIKKIYHFDMNEDVIKIAGLEMFGLTEYLPNKENQFKRANTFKYDFDEKYDYVLTNPPYGGDKTKKNTESLKNDKLIVYINKDLNDIKDQLKDDSKNKKLLEKQKNRQEQLESIKKHMTKDKKDQEEKKVNSATCSKLIKNYIKDNELKTCNDKEACSLVLLMTLLNKNGVCAGVLKEGVFFDKKYGSIRKCLVKNFNVKYVISVPQDQFENTSTKTSIIIFENTKEKTKEIVFYDLIVSKEKDDVFEEVGNQIQLVKCKDDIFSVKEKELCRCDVNDMKDDYSLNYKNYLKTDIKVQKGFKAIKIGDICSFKSGKQLSKSNFKEGKYPVIGGGQQPCGFHNEYNRDEYTILLSSSGNSAGFVNMYNSKVWASDCFSVHAKNNLDETYVYNYLKNIQDKLYESQQGSAQPHFYSSTLEKIIIPYPNNISIFKILLEKVQELYKKILDTNNSIPQKEKDICALIKKLTDEGKKGNDYDEYKLGDVCVVKAGKYLKNYKTGIYPIVGGGSVSGHIDNYTNENDYVIHKDGVSNKIISYINGKFFCNHHGWTITMTKKFINLKLYLSYWILLETQNIMKKLIGTNQKGLNQESFYDFKIRILKSEIIKKNKLDKMFEEVDKMKNDSEINKKEHSELSVKFMKMIDPNYEKIKNNDNISDETSDNDLESESDGEKPKKVNKKKLSAKKSKVVSKSKDSSNNESDGDSSEEETPKKKSDSDKPKKKAIKKNSDTKSKVDSSNDESDDSSSEEYETPKKVNKKPKVKTNDSKIKKKIVVSDSDDSSSDESVEEKPKKKVSKRNDDSDLEGEKPKKISKKKSNDKKK